jgi:ribosomal-protein-alanine N-acetyltransferase
MINLPSVKLGLPAQIFTDRLILRKLRYEEAEEIFYCYASKPEATRFMSWQTHQSIEDTRAFLQHAGEGWRNGTEYSFSIRHRRDNRFVGSFGIINDYGKVQFGYILGPAHWGKGYATEVCKAVMGVLRSIPEVWEVQTFVDADNTASANVLLKSGLIEDARFPQWFHFVNQGNQLKDCIHFVLPRENNTQ